MIEWEKRRFSCETCTKGHRASKCGHLNRVLKEIKTKGRPSTQCPTCRTKRNIGIGHSHHKCRCGTEPVKPFVIRLILAFENGLELHFIESKEHSMNSLQERLKNGSPFDLMIKKDETVHTKLVAKELRFEQEDIELELNSLLTNPCKCHYGQSCICSSKPNELIPEAKESEAVLGLSQLNSKISTTCGDVISSTEISVGGQKLIACMCIRSSASPTCKSCAGGCRCFNGCCNP